MSRPDSHALTHSMQLAEAMFARERQVADWWVLLWSHGQNGFHIEPHARMLEANRRAYADDRQMDYVPIFIGSKDACHSMAERLRGTVRARESSRQAVRALIQRAQVVRGGNA